MPTTRGAPEAAAARGSRGDVTPHKEDVMAKAKSPIPEGLHSVTPQLVFDNASQAIDWYKKALGAEEKSRAVSPDGQIMHAALQIGSSQVFVNDNMGDAKRVNAAPGSLPITLWLYVPDCDTIFNRALKAGAQVAPGPMGQMGDQFWGDRCGTLTDPYGYQWTIATHKEDLSPEEMDSRAQEFFKQFAHAAHA
jgi:uncharacterized glyoxalase superfamily protein PhnB